MADLIPPDVQPPDTAPDDPRVGHLLAAPDAPDLRVALVGFPSDEGVRRNGGRVGAAEGPRAIREALYRLTPDGRDPRMAERLRRTADLGDVPVTGDLEHDQDALAGVLAPLLARGVTPIVLGGGHEVAYGHFLGYVKAGQPTAILNWDAHADVRPLRDGQGHSGSPFRQALEHASGGCAGYTVVGLQPQAVALAHLAYLNEQGGTAVFFDEMTPTTVAAVYGALDVPTLVTFDLDAVDAAYAPGVSAPNPGGFAVSTWLDAAYHAGTHPNVRSIDVAELNPRFDCGGATARLAALTVWHFLRGHAVR